jgi:hypothetical protein
MHVSDISNRVLNMSGDAYTVAPVMPNPSVVAYIALCGATEPSALALWPDTGVWPISAAFGLPLAVSQSGSWAVNAAPSGTYPVSAANTLSAFITNSLSAQITNALSAQITNALSAQITNALSAQITNSLSANIYNALSAQITNNPRVQPIADNFVTTDGTTTSPATVTSAAATNIIIPADGVSMTIYSTSAVQVSETSGFANFFALPSGITLTVDVLNMTYVSFIVAAAGANATVSYMIHQVT